MKSFSAKCCSCCTHHDRQLNADQVEAALSEEAQERQSVADLKEQLAQLQAEVHAAHERLHITQV